MCAIIIPNMLHVFFPPSSPHHVLLLSSVSNGWRCHQAVQRPDSAPQQQQQPSSPPPSITPGPPPACRHKPGSRFLPGDSFSSVRVFFLSERRHIKICPQRWNKCQVSCLACRSRRGPLCVPLIQTNCFANARRPSGTDRLASTGSSFTPLMETAPPAAPSGWCSGTYWLKVTDSWFNITLDCRL